MAKKKKFGAFSGVFTPSILTILGVIMYLRMGWVVGNAGLIGTLAIIIIAHFISVSTGLSVSSIATDKKVGAGGIYYILSRSMGFPIGGAIGITLYIGTALSIALYLIGFAESFNGYLGLATDINGLRIGGTIALLSLTAIALVSTSAALKTQFFILAAIIISLVSIFFGTNEFAPQTVNFLSNTSSVSLEVVFAIFFPAVTGFTAGIAMSGDLQNSKKSIPIGTIAAIFVGLAVYIGLTFFLAYNVDSELLKSDYNILMKIAIFAPAVVAGIWGATLSSALGGILGGPRILQAMSMDSITPKFFAKGKGKNNEPVNALILVFLFAQAGILIGELDVIARIVSMFYLAAYGFINISFFLESWANPDFQPSFKVSRWIGLLGAIACFGVMFKLDMIAMFASFIIIGGIYVWLQRKRIKQQTGDVWQSVWENVVGKGLRKLEAKEIDFDYWNPNIILFSGHSKDRPHLLELSKMVAGRTGIITNFNFVKKAYNEIPLSKTQQTIKDETLVKLGIFGRKLEVDNIYNGMENIATTYGFSGITPNTILMGWGKTTQDPIAYANLTQQFVYLDYNLLYLDYDKRIGFGNYNTIDLWWRAGSNNAEMMVNIARFIIQTPQWAKAKIRILFVNHNNSDNSIIKSSIFKLIDKYRLNAEIKIVNNASEQKPIYEIIELQSSNSDLVVLGIPIYKKEEQANFIKKTNLLFKSIGTTLLVRASNNFNELDIEFAEDKVINSKNLANIKPLINSDIPEINEIIIKLDRYLSETAKSISIPTFSSLSLLYVQFVENIEMEFGKTMDKIEKMNSVGITNYELKLFLNNLISFSKEIKEEKLSKIQEFFHAGIDKLTISRNEFINNTPPRLNIILDDKDSKHFFVKKRIIKWKKILKYYNDAKINPNLHTSLYALGVQNHSLLLKLSENLIACSQLLVKNIDAGKENSMHVFRTNIINLFINVRDEFKAMEMQISNSLLNYERNLCNEITKELELNDINIRIKKLRKELKNRDIVKCENEISEYAFDWHRNQILFHNQFETSLNLAITGHSITLVNENLHNFVNEAIITPHKNKVNMLSEIINSVEIHFSQSNSSAYDTKAIDFLTENYTPINLKNILISQEDEIMYLLHSTLIQTELINKESMNSLTTIQNNELESSILNLTKIQDYTIQTYYLLPLQGAVQNFEKATNKTTEDIYNASNLLKYQIEETNKNPNSINNDTINEIIKELKKKIRSISQNIEKIVISFEDESKSNLENTITELSIKSIIDSIESQTQIANNPILKGRISKWFNQKNDSIVQFYRTVLDFIIQRKQNIDIIKFEEQHNEYLNIIDQTSNFISSISVKTNVSSKLSFYYKKLFSGSHLGLDEFVSRKKGFASAEKAVKKINSGVSGAIIVLGESLSGKTFFCETVAKTLISGNKFIINLPAEQNFNINDMHTALQKTFSRSGNSEAILNQIDKGAILIFNNIEKWWVRDDNGHIVINYLSKLIENFGNKHYFILNCNIHSFNVLRKISNIESRILTTIIIPPVSKLELAEILMKRHKVAGDKILRNNKLINDLKLNAPFFNDIYIKSKGNIGIALNMWLSNIEMTEDNNLIINEFITNKFPSINNSKWKIILYHFILHNHLTEHHIDRIFKNDNKWVFNSLKEMEKAELISKSNDNTYVLNKVAKYYIENELIELKILN